jgi:hypothetical protein
MVDLALLTGWNVVKATSSWRKSVEILCGARQMSRRSEAAEITPGAEYLAANAAAFIARLQEIVRHWPCRSLGEGHGRLAVGLPQMAAGGRGA